MNARTGMKKTIFIFGIIAVLLMVIYVIFKRNEISPTVPLSRPSYKEFLFDYAHILKDVEEYSNKYLKGIKERYSIEAVIVSIPSLEEKRTIEQTAVELLNNWQIGRETGGRGIVLLLADKEKQVKLEVSFELEDVFTDLFCGYIEDLQLRPYFLGGQLGIGLLAVMEEIENRAQIKEKGDYTHDYIAKLDRDLLSGGAGAKRDVSKFQKEEVKEVSQKYPAGKTPAEAWQTMLQSWWDKVRDPNLGVYTEVTKLTYRDYQNLSDSRYEKDVRTYSNKSYEVLQDGNYTVIFFGNKEGWDNSPFLFCKTPDGWKYDIVHQRKYVRMGSSPYWGIERGNYPYIDLLSPCPYWMGQDIPLESEDIYRTENDVRLAGEILRLEQEYKNNPNDFTIVMELGRLYTITSMGPENISMLNKAKQLNPNSPLPYKYLAIAHVDANYQYKTAIEELKEYVKKEPQDVFGHNYLGYLYYCVGEYERAIDEFKKAVQLRPDNCYAFCKLSRCYGQLYLKANALDPRRIHYKNTAIEMFHKAQIIATPDERRIGWLRQWLKEENILDKK